MNIEQRSIDSIRPYPRNPRRNDTAVARVADSIRAFGFQQPIVVDEQGVIVVGHTRFKAAKKLEMTQVPVTVMSGVSQSIINQYRIADNRLNELAEWDDTLLMSELKDILTEVGNTDLTGFTSTDLAELERAEQRAAQRDYSTQVDTPIYTPKGSRPALSELVNTEHRDRLTQEIDASTAPEDVKQFLRLAADRHRQFDYEQIAEYYSHADPETKRLFEASALVICDFDNAIEQGYVQMTDTLRQIFQQDYPNE